MIELLVKPALIAGVLALLVLLETYAPFFQARQHRLRHDAANLALGVINAGAVWLLLASGLWATSEWAAIQQFGLLNLLEWPPWLELIVALLLFDLWQYVWHRLNHRWAWLWRFHAVHHSDAEMDASSAVRFHTIEIMLSAALRMLIVPLLGMSLSQLLVYELLLLPVILFHHSNVRVPKVLDQCLKWLIVTPSIHRVHHSDVQVETDSNYASLFSWWDRCFGSQVVRADQQAIRLGLGSRYASYDWSSVQGMLRQPFVSRLYR